MSHLDDHDLTDVLDDVARRVDPTPGAWSDNERRLRRRRNTHAIAGSLAVTAVLAGGAIAGTALGPLHQDGPQHQGGQQNAAAATRTPPPPSAIAFTGVVDRYQVGNRSWATRAGLGYPVLAQGPGGVVPPADHGQVTLLLQTTPVSLDPRRDNALFRHAELPHALPTGAARLGKVLVLTEASGQRVAALAARVDTATLVLHLTGSTARTVPTSRVATTARTTGAVVFAARIATGARIACYSGTTTAGGSFSTC